MSASRAWARDLVGAIALAEGAIAQRVLVALDGPGFAETNAFGEKVTVEHAADVAALARRCAEAAAAGERVALVARASDLATARHELARIAARRLGVVVHALAEPAGPGVPASEAGIGPALALGDLPWGMLVGAGVADAVDLALIARRAAEDSDCPFFVVHERSHAHHVEPLAAPSRELCEAFLGGPRRPAADAWSRNGARPDGDRTLPAERAFAERVPFALGSAMRELEALTARHHDVIERVPGADSALALVGVGALGDSLLADVDRLRAGGHDVGAVRVVAWRPFPGARLVKALCRSLAISVLESVDRPLAPSGPLSVQLKAAFADALTWAPDYPGIGRIPRIVAGVVAPRREVDSVDVDAIVHNMLADERGKRMFVLGGDEAAALLAPPVARGGAASGQAFAVRGTVAKREVAIAAADLCTAVLTSVLGLRTRVAVRDIAEDEGGGYAFDLTAARDRPRGAHAPHAVRVVALGDASALARGNALLRLARGGLLAVPTRQKSADALWAEVPPWAKAVAFDRAARVVGWTGAVPGESPWVTAAGFVGLTLAAAVADRVGGQARPIDGAVVAREVADALRSAGAGAADVADRGAQVAREAFEAHVEVPRATIEREDDGVRLGRRDARVSNASDR